jgi:hypothetical protein
MRIYKTQEILDDFENSIKKKKPFSLLRFGDGMIKFIYSMLYNDTESLDIICKKEGLPRGNKLIYIYELIGYYARCANYIDSPEVYFNGFWTRTKRNKKISTGTYNKLIKWKELYYSAEFDNENYCNPEVNFLMLLTSLKKTIIDIMKGKKVCIITNYPSINKKFKGDFDITTIGIVNQYEDHFYNSFKKITDIIHEKVNEFDFWLVSAGELGRIYTGMIKEYGGRAIDIGSVIKFWIDGEIPDRLYPYIRRSRNPKKVSLTLKGKEYGNYI